MKRSILFVVLVIIGLFVAPFAAFADAPTAEPPIGSEPPTVDPTAPIAPPAEEAIACPPPAFMWEDDCTFWLDGDLSASEISTAIALAAAGDPFFGTQPLDLGIILRYLQVHTVEIPGYGPLTAIKVMATCKLLVASERLNEEMYYKCYAILSHAIANLEELCPTLSKMITFLLGRAGSATMKKMLESAQAAHNAFCFGKTV